MPLKTIALMTAAALAGAAGTRMTYQSTPETLSPPTSLPQWIQDIERTEHHERLDKLTGNWRFSLRITEVVENQLSGNAQIQPILDGKFHLSTYRIRAGEREAVETAITGYDAHAQQYFTFSANSVDNNLYFARGTLDKETNSVRWEGVQVTPEGTTHPTAALERHLADDHITFSSRIQGDPAHYESVLTR